MNDENQERQKLMKIKNLIRSEEKPNIVNINVNEFSIHFSFGHKNLLKKICEIDKNYKLN
jgi:hypothetical protein